MIASGRAFYKMSGSGNDFVMVDTRLEPPGRLREPETIRRICAHGTGVGADGIVFLERSDRAAIRLTYLNSDGSLADFCGNATLCTTRLSIELGIGSPEGLAIETDWGVVAARIDSGKPGIDLQPVSNVEPIARAIAPEAGEHRIGFAMVGVPHIVILCDDVNLADVTGRGRTIRWNPSLQAGANVNFVSRQSHSGDWRIRTYERGVEAETLACGSGAVAAAILLTAWGEATGDVNLETKSGRTLRVRIRHDEQAWQPSLSGEGRIVFQGILSEI